MKINWKHLVLIIFAGVILYANSVNNPFLWDDETRISKNITVEKWETIEDWKNIDNIVSRDYFSFFKESSYRPIPTISYFINYKLWRLKPFGWRASSIILHVLNGIFVCLIVSFIFRNTSIGLLAGLFFTTHPVHSETLLVATFNEDLFCTLFCLISFYTYLLGTVYTKRFSIPYMLSLFFYTLALFSKEIALVLPILIISYDKLIRGTSISSNLRRYGGYFSLIVIFLGVQFFVMHTTPLNEIEYPGGSYFSNILTMSKVLIHYLKLTFLPYPLSVEYIIPASSSFSDPVLLFSFILLLVLAYTCIKIHKNSKISFYWTFWFFLPLLPVLNLIPFLNISLMAERYLYMPIVGFCVLLATVIVKISSKYNIKNVLYLASPILVIYSFIVITRNLDWEDPITFYENAAKISPNSYRIHNNLAAHYRKNGQFKNAVNEYNLSLRLQPNVAGTYFNIGNTYLQSGELKEAIINFNKSIKLLPTLMPTYHVLASYYLKYNDYLSALNIIKKGLGNNPNDQQLIDFLAVVYFEMGKKSQRNGNLDQAILNYIHSIKIKPNVSDVHYNLGVIYADMNLYSMAIEEFSKSLEINPNDVDSYYNLGMMYIQQHKYESAKVSLQEVLKRNPSHKMAKFYYNGLFNKKN